MLGGRGGLRKLDTSGNESEQQQQLTKLQKHQRYRQGVPRGGGRGVETRRPQNSLAPNLLTPTFVELITAMLQTVVAEWSVELPTSADGQ